jgi:hypothetical protein
MSANQPERLFERKAGQYSTHKVASALEHAEHFDRDTESYEKPALEKSLRLASASIAPKGLHPQSSGLEAV